MTADHVASETIFGDAPIFVFCDHASNAMPDDLKSLGLPDDLLETHIAWDIGAGALSEAIARRLRGRVFQCRFSRLIIDPNRADTAHDLIPTVSDQIPIPGNQMLTNSDRLWRLERFFSPYHRRLRRALDQASQERDPFVVSIHSFTRRLMGAESDRPWPIGLLWREDEESARTTIAALTRAAGWPIGDNEPYDARVFNYTVDRHVGPRGLRHLTIEVRQDTICDADGVEKMSAVIAAAIAETAFAPAARAANDGGPI